MKRNNTVDILRCLGTLLVILAHTSPPATIAGMRTFDVCLLVMISGYCSNYKCGNFGPYIVKRIKRLCVPAWKTMTLIFVTCGVLCLVSHRPYLYSLKQIVETYLFIGGMEGGIGLFWIVRIYLLVALLTPVADRIGKAPFWVTGVSVAGLLALNEGCYAMLWNKSAALNFILENVVMSGLAYAAVYIIGISIRDKHCVVKYLLASAGIFFLLEAIFKQEYFSKPSAFKYPPQLGYVIYGIFVSTLLWIIVEQMRTKTPTNWVRWISANSFNMYLAHALIMYCYSWGDKYISRIPWMKYWLVRFCVFISGSACLVNLCLRGGKGRDIC